MRQSWPNLAKDSVVDVCVGMRTIERGQVTIAYLAGTCGTHDESVW